MLDHAESQYSVWKICGGEVYRIHEGFSEHGISTIDTISLIKVSYSEGLPQIYDSPGPQAVGADSMSFAP